MKSLVFVLFCGALVVGAQTSPAAAQTSVSPPGATSTPPPATAAKPLRLPTPSETMLPNGLRVIAVRTTRVPLVSAALVSKRGSASDAPEKLGVAAMTAAVMTAGTTTRDATAIANAIDQLGANLFVGARPDSTTASVNATSDKFAQALDIMADVTRNATFPAADVERERAQALASLKQSGANIEGLAREAALRALFGSEAYGNPASGTSKTVAALGRDDLVAFRDAAFRPDNAFLVIAGDIDPTQAFALAQTSFGTWKKPAGAPQPTEPRPVSLTPRFVVIDKEDAGAGSVVAAYRGVARTSSDYASEIITNSVLNGYSGRLNEEVRVKRGFAYGAGSQFDAGVMDGSISAYTLSVENPKIPDATDVVLATVRGLGSAQVTQAELDTRRTSFLGGIGASLQRESGVVAMIAGYARYGLPLSQMATAFAAPMAVTPAQVQAFAAAHLQQPTVVIVGKASVFLPALKAKYPNVQVIPFESLDLAAASLMAQ